MVCSCEKKNIYIYIMTLLATVVIFSTVVIIVIVVVICDGCDGARIGGIDQAV